MTAFKKTSILFVHSIGKKKFGGGEKWLIQAAAGLLARGHEVYVGSRPGSRLMQIAQEREIPCVSLNIVSDISPYHMLALASLIKQKNIQVVITRQRDLTVTGIAARMASNPLVIVRHGLPLRRRIRKHTFLLRKLADGIITNTQSIKAHYEDKNWVKKDFTQVIYNGVCIDHQAKAHAYASVFPDKKIILSIGRLATQKGYSYLIDAIVLLKKRQHSQLLFFILGEGKLHQQLESYAINQGVRDMIHFEGFSYQVAPYINGCDIFILPSLYEGMPNAAIEAMACEKPCIITDVNGARELIPDETKGLLIPPAQPSAIADAIEDLLGNPEKAQAMGQLAAKHIAQHFQLNTMVTELESYLCAALEKKHGS